MFSPYVKTLIVLLLTFLLTIASTIVSFGMLLFLFGRPSHIVDLLMFFMPIVFAGIVVRHFAKTYLFDKKDEAELQMLGGIRIGRKSATWPFAKLSVSESALRLQTPFGDYAWLRTDPRLVIRKTWLGHLKVGPDDLGLTGTIYFVPVAPWQIGSIERKLKDLGYRL